MNFYHKIKKNYLLQSRECDSQSSESLEFRKSIKLQHIIICRKLMWYTCTLRYLAYNNSKAFKTGIISHKKG